ncbi:ribonucleoside-diphosphate reductase subunit alpha [Pseudobacteriovorax antillogorgiicola]|uniref:Ribonucleoside-diphosphate reductase n=1 Tax=Pseudobacteriovorax antillogorgiicola TaxID=1513793 RepID=A0A1Y6CJM6_9BACT|nr:ribonucleoside-diphosphate reductase subunit alpha [Pseudobacteriovorax antillogorgiicola]TCS46106.1 ribonucleoside-diphosphate reductase alpha chain [Pseudobacteriovorax antillogorgiicola]SMF69423.1 ribonucleoside-diphosphate reductase alpha chain [Pseudobacteriovorax antillogorgiicola]
MSLLTNHSPSFDSDSSINKPGEAEIYLTKRDGQKELLDIERLLAAIQAHCYGLDHVDAKMIAEKVSRGLYNGVSTVEIDNLLIQSSAMFIADEPQYSKLAARLLNTLVRDEVKKHGINSFSDSIAYGHQVGILSDSVLSFVEQHGDVLNQAIQSSQSDLFEYFGLRTVYDRYLLKDPEKRTVFETPQYFFMRVACGLSKQPEEAIEFYQLISSFEYMPSTPTLFNSATQRSQMSSCYLLDSPEDSLESIYDKYKDVALLSKFAGGIGLAYHRVRSQGSLIRGTNGRSNGIIPFLKTLDSSVSAVNQGGKRKGAACIYLESWHADILDFLQLRENTGDESRRTHNLNIANWIPDLFMKRVENDELWSLFDPSIVPHFTDLYGDEFDQAYREAENQGLAKKQIKARELYASMMKCLAQTGNGWMTFKDSSNLKCNQVGSNKDNVVHLSNLCTEIIEVTSNKETAVCNLGSINLSRYVENGDINYKQLAENVRLALKYLDRVIDINFYPIHQAEDSNNRWRPVGLGLMGLQDAFFKLDIPFDSPRAREVSRKVQEEIYYNALKASCELAAELGPHSSFAETRAAKGDLQFDLWGVSPSQPERWESLRSEIKKHGLRNSLMIAIAPTATIASICGSYECIEPQLSNLFKRETLSGEFLQVNTYLVAKLKELGIWNESVKQQIKLAEGSIQGIEGIPQEVKDVFRTAWEVPMRSLIDMAADRGAFIDQSQSLNLFIESPTIGKLSSMYNYTWKKGLKTSYYLRSRAATKINKTTIASSASAVACSLENPETCEACQ